VAESRSRYIPALSFRWLTALYDPLLKWGMREHTFKQRLLDRAAVRAGQHALDLGCGTGTLTLMLKRAVPGANVTGIDGDRQVLAIARSKAKRARADIAWDYGLAAKLPYPDNSFDAVLSSLVLHHLATVDKRLAFQEIRRILRPGGRFVMLDFGPPFDPLTQIQALVMRHLEETADNFSGRIQVLLTDSGFQGVVEMDPMHTVFGPIWLYRGLKGKDDGV
jgi:ubiquinone/menaquinone biosynthesis C-methylase UbiE